MVTINNAINNTIGGSNSGVTNTLTITNSSNTASSQALENIVVAGATAGDAFTTYTVTGVTNWSQGIDNSVSGDPYVLAASTALGTTNVLTATTAGVVNALTILNVGTSPPANPTYDFVVEKSTSGGAVVGLVRNASNTATSDAILAIATAGSTARSPWISWNVEGVQTFGAGISAGAVLAIVPGSAPLSTTQGIQMDSTGRMNYPSQPAFLAYLPTSDLNQTGNGATYTLGSGNALTELYDQNSNFDPSTGTFTAPKAGKYHFEGAFYVFGNTIASTFVPRILTTTNTYDGNFTRTASNLDAGITISITADMALNDTANLQLLVLGEAANTSDIAGEATVANRVTRFSGWLVC